MGRGVTDGAAIEVHTISLRIAARKHDAPAEAVTTLRIDESGLKELIQRITTCGEMAPEHAAGCVAQAELVDQIGIAEATLSQVVNGFGAAMQLELVKGGGLVQQAGGGNRRDV